VPALTPPRRLAQAYVTISGWLVFFMQVRQRRAACASARCAARCARDCATQAPAWLLLLLRLTPSHAAAALRSAASPCSQWAPSAPRTSRTCCCASLVALAHAPMRPQAWDRPAAPPSRLATHARLRRTACEPHAARRPCCGGAAPAAALEPRCVFAVLHSRVACARRSYIFLDATVGALGFYLLGYGFAYGDRMECVAARRRSAACAHCCCPVLRDGLAPPLALTPRRRGAGTARTWATASLAASSSR
jgi:hypothetical protein